mmetsp:Transcript_51589/g.101855  ORF Transcript_51589/g.101855 Transcript_51589/m.101855 type:complete len:216 (+) Transcript_51589:644-1291(+)
MSKEVALQWRASLDAKQEGLDVPSNKGRSPCDCLTAAKLANALNLRGVLGRAPLPLALKDARSDIGEASKTSQFNTMFCRGEALVIRQAAERFKVVFTQAAPQPERRVVQRDVTAHGEPMAEAEARRKGAAVHRRILLNFLTTPCDHRGNLFVQLKNFLTKTHECRWPWFTMPPHNGGCPQIADRGLQTRIRKPRGRAIFAKGLAGLVGRQFRNG